MYIKPRRWCGFETQQVNLVNVLFFIMLGLNLKKNSFRNLDLDLDCRVSDRALPGAAGASNLAGSCLGATEHGGRLAEKSTMRGSKLTSTDRYLI